MVKILRKVPQMCQIFTKMHKFHHFGHYVIRETLSIVGWIKFLNECLGLDFEWIVWPMFWMNCIIEWLFWTRFWIEWFSGVIQRFIEWKIYQAPNDYRQIDRESEKLDSIAVSVFVFIF